MKKSLGFILLAVAFVATAFASGASNAPQKSPPVVPNISASAFAAAENSTLPITMPVAVSLVALAPRTGGGLVAILAAGGLALYLFSRETKRHGPRNLITAINTLPANVGTSQFGRRFRAAAAVTTRYLLCKKGADDEHAAAVAAASDEPIGAFTDESAAAEDLINVDLFGINSRTLPLVAKVAITLGADVYSDGTGKVTVKPTAAGTYWKVGKAMTASGADGDPIEVLPIKPRKLIVVAALTQTSNATIAGLPSTAVNPTKADFDRLLVEAGKLQADFYVLSAALTGDADVTVATT